MQPPTRGENRVQAAMRLYLGAAAFRSRARDKDKDNKDKDNKDKDNKDKDKRDKDKRDKDKKDKARNAT